MEKKTIGRHRTMCVRIRLIDAHEAKCVFSIIIVTCNGTGGEGGGRETAERMDRSEVINVCAVANHIPL